MFLANKLAGSGSVAKTYVDDVFAITLYTGGVVSPVVNGIDLAGKGGLTIFKSRTTDINGIAGNTAVLDTIRGLSKLQLTDTSPQATFSGAVTSFNNDGFTLGSSASAVNYSGTPYVNYTFRKAAKFFDVVSYTGNNQIRTISHSLGSTPGMVFLKRYSGASASWIIYHRSLTATSWTGVSYSGINTTASIWNNTEPTTTGFTIGNNQHNTTGESNIAYLFGHDTSSDGLIFCDQFTTDASGLATVTIGWEPQFLWAKEKNNSGADGGWIMLDIQRGWSLSDDAKISPSSTAAEVFGDHGNPTSDGFVFNGAASAGYIYMAIRRSNKPPTSGTQVFTVDNATGFTDAQTIAKQDLFISAIRSSANGYTPAGFSWGDRVRGYGASSTKTLNSSSTASEVEDTMFPFGSSGYVWNAGGGFPRISYRLKRAAGFFDVVGYIGQDSANLVVKHNLGVIPQLMLIKNRTFTGGRWKVRVDLGSPNELILSTTDGFIGNFGITNVTASSFELLSYGGSHTATNGNKYIVYLFATLPGVSKVGSYTGNGSAMTINCGFATGARFVMIKRTDATGDWCVFDTVRGITDEYTNDPVILMNSTGAETNTVSQLKPNALGFNIYQDAANNLNVLNATYIFLAIA